MGDILDVPLLALSRTDAVTTRDLCAGILAIGSPGSGKTSGPLAAIGEAMLRAGFGGIVMCAKPDEAQRWHDYAARCGRSGSIIEFSPDINGFNFLAYELLRMGQEGINSVIECLMRVLEIARLASPSPGRVGDEFWSSTSRQMLRAGIPVIHAATGTVRVADILRFVRSAPTPEQMADIEWQRGSFFFQCFMAARDRLDDATGERATAYWRNDFAQLDAKTRGNIVISLTTALSRFETGWLERAFCGETTIVPELTFHGAIILLNMPVLTFQEDAIIAQQVFKYMWQRAVLARNGLSPEQQARPVFLFADEAHLFTLPQSDAEFLSLCRSSRACTVYASQSLPSFYAKAGGDGARDPIHQLVANFGTKIWCSLSCPETAEFAARSIGKALQNRANCSQGEGTNENHGMNMGDGTQMGVSHSNSQSFTSGQRGGTHVGNWSGSHSSGSSDNRGRNRGHGSSRSSSWGHSETMDYIVEPGSFGRMLKTGGPSYGNRVSAIWTQAGRRFAASGGNALLAEFAQ